MHQSNLARPLAAHTGHEAVRQTERELATVVIPVELKLRRDMQLARRAAARRNRHRHIVVSSGIYREYRAF